MTRTTSILAACAFFLSATDAAQAQTPEEMVGSWEMVFEMGSGTSAYPMDLAVSGDSLAAFWSGTEEPVVMAMTMGEEELSIRLDTGHAVIDCTLILQESREFAGFCAGPAGDIPTVFRRKDEPGS